MRRTAADCRIRDKFTAYGLTPRPASQVTAPCIDECWEHLERRVVDTRAFGRYGLFVLEVVAAQVDPRTLPHCGCGRFMVAGETIRLPSKRR